MRAFASVLEPEDLLVGLGRAIRELRDGRNISQEALSLSTGVHRNYIGGVERAERQPTVVVVARLAAALDVSVSELFRLAEAVDASEDQA